MSKPTVKAPQGTVRETPKQAVVSYTPKDAYFGPDEKKPNVATFFFLDNNGKDVRYDIKIGVPVVVPLALAEDMKRKGQIESYQVI